MRAIRSLSEPRSTSCITSPAGFSILRVVNVIAAGVVLNPPTLLAEIDSLLSRGIQVGENLLISQSAHVVLPWHLEEDRILNDAVVEGENIGTTLRGIGPCYRDKVGRNFAIRLGDLYRPDFPEKVRQIAVAKRAWLESLSGGESVDLDAEAVLAQCQGYATRLQPHVAETTQLLLDALEAEKRLLFEAHRERCWISTTERIPS